jgi:hypothetical protein
MLILRSRVGRRAQCLVVGWLLGSVLWPPSLLFCKHEDGRIVIESVGQSLGCCLGSARRVALDAESSRCSDTVTLRVVFDAPDSGSPTFVGMTLVPGSTGPPADVCRTRSSVDEFQSRQVQSLRALRTVVLQA